MNCQEFEERLQATLDERRNPTSDSEVARHTKICGGCRESLDTWMRVASLMPPCPTDTITPVDTKKQPDTKKSARQPTPATRPARGGWSGPSRAGGFAVGGLAAAGLFFLLVPGVPERYSPVPSVALETQVATEAGDVFQDTFTYSVVDDDLVAWWERVDGQEWVNQTMPTFRSMREGVAPLRRTLVRAVTILTIGSRSQTS